LTELTFSKGIKRTPTLQRTIIMPRSQKRKEPASKLADEVPAKRQHAETTADDEVVEETEAAGSPSEPAASVPTEAESEENEAAKKARERQERFKSLQARAVSALLIPFPLPPHLHPSLPSSNIPN
jgi:hypothetical protein